MSEAPRPHPDQPVQGEEIPDRLCTWCRVPMHKRIVGGGLYIHYTCPKCIFQHATKRCPSGTPQP